VPQRWWLETKSRGRGEATRGKSWPNIYRALSSGTRGGIAGQHADPIRRALWDVHLETVAALPDAAVEPRHAVRAALDRRPIPLAREVAQTLRVSPPASNAKSRWRCAHRPPE
jgi:hypothetical protein